MKIQYKFLTILITFSLPFGVSALSESCYKAAKCPGQPGKDVYYQKQLNSTTIKDCYPRINDVQKDCAAAKPPFTLSAGETWQFSCSNGCTPLIPSKTVEKNVPKVDPICPIGNTHIDLNANKKVESDECFETGYFLKKATNTFYQFWDQVAGKWQSINILPDGKVGIGTTTPQAILDVQGTGTLSQTTCTRNMVNFCDTFRSNCLSEGGTLTPPGNLSIGQTVTCSIETPVNIAAFGTIKVIGQSLYIDSLKNSKDKLLGIGDNGQIKASNVKIDSLGNLSVTASGDNLGNHQATKALDLNSNNINEANNVNSKRIITQDSKCGPSCKIAEFIGSKTVTIFGDGWITAQGSLEVDGGVTAGNGLSVEKGGANIIGNTSITNTSCGSGCKIANFVGTKVVTIFGDGWISADNSIASKEWVTAGKSISAGGAILANDKFEQRFQKYTNFGPFLYASGKEAGHFDGNEFSWGFGGNSNYFADDVKVGTNGTSKQICLNGDCRSSWNPQQFVNLQVDQTGKDYKSQGVSYKLLSNSAVYGGISLTVRLTCPSGLNAVTCGPSYSFGEIGPGLTYSIPTTFIRNDTCYATFTSKNTNLKDNYFFVNCE